MTAAVSLFVNLGPEVCVFFCLEALLVLGRLRWEHVVHLSRFLSVEEWQWRVQERLVALYKPHSFSRHCVMLFPPPQA